MKLEALRNYRGQVEDILRLELADLERYLQAAEESLRRLEIEADGDAKRYLTDTHAGLTADEVVERYAELDALTSAIRRARDVVEEARVRRDRKMGEVLEASREKKKLEILGRREALRSQRELDRKTQQAVDETAGRRFIAERGPRTEPGYK